MDFIASDLERRAHGVFLRAAGGDANAPVDRIDHRALVMAEFVHRGEFKFPLARGHAQPVGDLVGVDENSGVK